MNHAEELIAALRALPRETAASQRVAIEVAERFLANHTKRAPVLAADKSTDEHLDFAPIDHPARKTSTQPDSPTADASSRLSTDPSLADALQRLRTQTLACTICEHLAKSRTQVVFGVGNPEARLMFVGEAPGADEDREGEPFVGAAGKLLTKMILAMGLTREEVYIANVLKCRPDMPPGSSGNRAPRAEEMSACLPYLQRQIALIRPEAIVALGATALQGLFGLGPVKIGALRGKWRELQIPSQPQPFHVPVMVTYHPAYLLRNQLLTEKRKVWQDLLAVLERLRLPIHEKQRRYFTKVDE